MNIFDFFCTKAANRCRLHLTIFSVYLSNFGLNYFLFLSLSISVRLFIFTLISLHGFSLPPVVYRKPAPQTCSPLSVLMHLFTLLCLCYMFSVWYMYYIESFKMCTCFIYLLNWLCVNSESIAVYKRGGVKQSIHIRISISISYDSESIYKCQKSI